MFLSSLVLSLALSAQAAPEQTLYPRIRLRDHLPPIGDGDSGRAGTALDFVRAGGEVGLPITPPAVEMTAREDMSPISLSLTFNWVWLTDEGGRHPVWFARLRAADRDRSIERFADSRTCPAVEESLRQLDGLPMIDPRVPQLPDPSAPSPFVDFGGYMHDNTYRIRLRGLFAGGRYTDRLELTGGSSAPFARIVGESLTRLLPCWTETPPPRA